MGKKARRKQSQQKSNSQPQNKTLQNAHDTGVQMSKDEEQIIRNSLTGLLEGLGYGAFDGSQINQVDTLFKNNRWYMLSNMRQILSELYVEHGIVQTLVDQPVDDGFRGGIKINSDQLSEDELIDLQNYLDTNNIIETIKQGVKWTRLFGGGGVLLMTDQKPDMPLTALKKGSKLEFRAVDMWELFYATNNTQSSYDDISAFYDDSDKTFNYYGINVNSSRVLITKGKQAPSFVRPRLRGWGMSVVERMVRSFNQYLKNNDVIFDLLDEAKIDIYGITGFNAAMGTPAGTEAIRRRCELVNQVKNHQNSVVMDKEDSYEQKQMTFSGLADMLNQIRQGVASDLKMPITKLFGVSSAGFNSGEDDIENYNAMIESEIRSHSKTMVISIIKIICEVLFGQAPTDLDIEFYPLRVLSAEQEENVKNKKFDRFSAMWAQGLFTDKEYSELLRKHELLDIDTEVQNGTREIEPPAPPTSFQTPQSLVPTHQQEGTTT